MIRGTRWRGLCGVIAGLLLSACGASGPESREPAQTEAQGYAALCSGSVEALRAGLEANEPALEGPAQRISWLTDWIDTHVTNDTVLTEFRTLASAPDRSAALMARARAAGVPECPFATEVWSSTETAATDGEPSADSEFQVTTSAELTGTLTPEAIRDVVRRNLNQVRYCHEQALSAEVPVLPGRVEVAFIIGESGAVDSAELTSSSLADPAVGSCIVGAVSRWAFPAPTGGRVGVRYPFVFGAE